MKLNHGQKRLLYSGSVWALYETVTAGFLIVFALALGASNTVVGVLGALPYVAMLVMEIPGAKLVEFFRRKTVYVAATALSRLSWLLIILTPYLFKQYTLWFVGGFFFIMRCLDYLADPAWTSWAADLVPERVRGEFWGLRGMFVSLIGMIASLLAGVYLDLFPKESYIGFATLFGVGILFGLWATRIMSKTAEPAYRDHDHHRLREFFQIDGQFRRYCWIMVAYNFAVMIASPFFTVYMLKDLGLSYTAFVAVGAIATISRILAHPHFGFVSDRMGDRPVAFLCMLGTAIVPLAYIFITRETLWLIVPVQILSGLVWAGTELATWNMLLDLTHRDKRAMQVAEYNLLNSIPNIIAPVIGGLVADNVAIIFTGIPLLFALATVLRAGTALLLMGLRETRVKAEHPISEVFVQSLTVHPLHGMETAIKVVVKRIRQEFEHERAPYPVNKRVIRFESPKLYKP